MDGTLSVVIIFFFFSPSAFFPFSQQVIPRTLAQNCGANIIRLLTNLRAKHASGETFWGVDGESGELTDMRKIKIWEPLSVKLQVYKTAVEVMT